MKVDHQALREGSESLPESAEKRKISLNIKKVKVLNSNAFAMILAPPINRCTDKQTYTKEKTHDRSHT